MCIRDSLESPASPERHSEGFFFVDARASSLLAASVVFLQGWNRRAQEPGKAALAMDPGSVVPSRRLC